MKRIQCLFLFIMILLLLSACGNTQTRQTTQVDEPTSNDSDEQLTENNYSESDKSGEILNTIEEYDIIFLGYPNWWYSCPMAIYSFLDEHDLTGKQVYLFCSHGTGGLASSVRDIKAALPNNTTVSDNVFHVYQGDMSSAQKDILNWLKELNY